MVILSLGSRETNEQNEQSLPTDISIANEINKCQVTDT